MITSNVVSSMMKLTAVGVTAGALALGVPAVGLAQQTVNSTNGGVVDGRGGGGQSTNNYDWTNGAYYEPHPRRINQSSAGCPSSGPGRTSCLHQHHHNRSDE